METADILTALGALATKTTKKAQILDLLPGIQAAREAKVSWSQIALTLRGCGVEISADVLRMYCYSLAAAAIRAQPTRNSNAPETHQKRSRSGAEPKPQRTSNAPETDQKRSGSETAAERQHASDAAEAAPQCRGTAIGTAGAGEPVSQPPAASPSGRMAQLAGSNRSTTADPMRDASGFMRRDISDDEL